MLKKLNKFIAVLVISLFVGVNALPTMVYASELIQDNKTSEENVTFDARINEEYASKSSITENSNLNLAVSVLNTGYLKDAVISVENGNYKMKSTENESINSMSENEIKLNEITANTEVKLNIPILFKSQDMISKAEYSKDSKVVLKATYVNATGRSKKITKELTENLTWTYEANEKVSQELIAYKKFDGKTILAFKVNDGIENNIVPVSNKTLQIVAPVINNANPEEVKVSGEGVEYSFDKGILTITKTNSENEEGKYRLNSNESYFVTYIYGSQTDEKSVTSGITANVTTINGEELKAETAIEASTFDISNELGNFANINQANTSTVNKGYMYTSIDTNNNINTQYVENYNIDVISHDLIASIKLDETSNYFNSNENLFAPVNKKVSINKEQLVKLFGEDGVVTVKADDKELGKLNKDVESIDIDTASAISILTSSPKTEGTLSISITREIPGSSNYSKEKVQSFATMQSNWIETILKNGAEISKSDVSFVTNLAEPKTSASLEINKESLSTVITNNDVIFNVLLNTADISNTLYVNPTIKLTLPAEVTSTNVKEVNVLYDDEMKFESVEANANQILVKLSGTQTKYNTESIEKGTLIRIVADVALNKLAPSVDSKVILEYTNERDASINSLENNMKVVAPTGFVTVNTLSANGTQVSAIETDAEPIKVLRNSAEEQVVTVTGTIVNNLGTDANGLTIVGIIPTGISTKLTSPISTTGLEGAKVQYSTETDVSNKTTSWVDEYTQEAQSYKITIPSVFAQASIATFTYTANLPANLGANLNASESFGVYYDNNSEEGIKSNLIKAKLATVTTGGIPSFEINMSAKNAISGEKITDEVKEEELIDYTFKVKNNGTDKANGAKLVVELPEGYTIDENAKTEFDLGSMEKGEEKVVTLQAKAEIAVSDNAEENALEIKAKVNALDENGNIMDDVFTTSTMKQTLVDGTITLRLAENHNNEIISKNSKVYFEISYINETSKDLKNVKVNFEIPDGLKYESNTGAKVETAKLNGNKLTVEYDTLKSGNGDSFYICTNVEKDITKEYTAYITATADGMKEMKSNVVKVGQASSSESIKVKQSTSVTSSQNVKDTDTVEFYLDIENISKITQRVQYYYSFNNITSHIKTTIEQNGEKSQLMGVEPIITIPAQSKVRIIETVDTYTKQKDEKASIIFTPELSVLGTVGLTELKLQKQEIVISGTNIAENVIDENQTFSIGGQAWLDINENGKREDSEELLKDIEVYLYNLSTKTIAKDANGKEYKTKTAQDGSYSFNSVKVGKYNVVAKFDNSYYTVGKYNVKDLSENENNDFVLAIVNNEEVASTNTINITNTNAFNVDLGLVNKERFDLQLDQTISKIIAINSKTNKTKEYNYNSKIAKIEVSPNDVQNTTVLVEYKIKIANVGNVAGYANEIVDYLPKDMAFNSELNTDWYITKDGYAHNQMVGNTLIQPGETLEVTLVLTRILTGENVGTARNTVEIASTYNELGLEDINSTAGNKQDGENDQSSVDAVILMTAGKEILSIAGLSLGILALVALAVYEIKIHVINKSI